MGMNRRSFLQSLGLGVAAVYLRLAPEKAREVPALFRAPDGEMLLGHKGEQILETGFIYLAPYAPLYVTREVGLSDFANKPARGWFSRRSLF